MCSNPEDTIELHWDPTILIDVTVEHNNPDLVIADKLKKLWTFVDFSVPWMDQGSGFDIVIVNTYLLHSMVFGWVGSLCVFGFRALGSTIFFDTFRSFLCGVENYLLNSVILLLVWCKATLGVPSL